MDSEQDQHNLSSSSVENSAALNPKFLEQAGLFESINLNENTHDEDSDADRTVDPINPALENRFGSSSFCHRFRNALRNQCIRAYHFLLEGFYLLVAQCMMSIEVSASFELP